MSTKAGPGTGPQKPILGFEHVDANADPALPDSCTTYNVGSASVGVVTPATDSTLANPAPPLRLK